MLPYSAYVIVDSTADRLSPRCVRLSSQLVESLDLLPGELYLRLFHNALHPSDLVSASWIENFIIGRQKGANATISPLWALWTNRVNPDPFTLGLTCPSLYRINVTSGTNVGVRSLLSITGIAIMQMSDNLIESLLHQDEGPTLDFKGNQYQFKKSDTPQKTEKLRSHLVKDLLAFANTHRDSSAFILIGVEEAKGSRSNVIGVKEHLIDDDLHDFMNKLTNRPVQFSYIQYNFEGVEIGVIVIPVQAVLFYLIKPYGELQTNAVYVKDGSSTRIATPDEVVEMSTTQPPSLVVDWVDPRKNEVIGSPCMLRPLVLIPTLGTDAIHRSPLPNRGHFAIQTHSYNEDYPKQLIIYTYCRNAFSSLSLQIHNHGEVTGENVCFEGLIEKSNSLFVMDSQPDFPTEIYELISPIRNLTYASPPTEILLSEESDHWLIQVEFGNVRPGERIVADGQLWFSSHHTMSVTMTGKILGENIPEPIQCSIKINFETLQRPMTIEDINHAIIDNEHKQ